MCCTLGLEVIGKNAKGKDMVKMSDAPPDKNGIEEFCSTAEYATAAGSAFIPFSIIFTPTRSDHTFN